MYFKFFQMLRMEGEKTRMLATKGENEKLEKMELELGQERLQLQQMRNKYTILHYFKQ